MICEGKLYLKPGSTMEQEWAIRLFKKSILKQNKFKELVDFLGSTEGLHCLDIGSDNGVVSYLLRQRGGQWKSADLDSQTTQCIRDLVRDEVYQINGRQTPFRNAEFDRVAIVDFLEHIPTDREFLDEMYRVMKPEGVLIINAPHIRNTLLRRFRLWLGQTDEKHGHVRPGYTFQGLESLLKGRFEVIRQKTYSRFFSEVIDTVITFFFDFMKKRSINSAKGLVVQGNDLKKYQKIFRVYSWIYPVVWFFAQLDKLLFWQTGYMLMVKAEKNKK